MQTLDDDAQRRKLDALRRAVQSSVASIKAGKISRATADDIVRKAKERDKIVAKRFARLIPDGH